MWTLIRKDLRLLRSSLLFYAVVGAAIVTFFGPTEEGAAFATTWTFVLPYFLIARLCYQEELNGGLSLLCSLPVGPAAIVWSKFLGGLLLVVYSDILINGMIGLARVMNWWPAAGGAPPVFALAFALTLLLVLSGLFLLAFFAWDYRRAGYVLLLPFLGFLPLAFPSSLRPILRWLVEKAAASQGTSPALLMVVAALASYLALGFLSVWVFSRRDVG
ncbi:MAG: ABC-2 transporter permease [Clostridia bacterium]|nr:ABC-2 transporter permease [Clostridia bacterium]